MMEFVSDGHGVIGSCSLYANLAGIGQILLAEWECCKSAEISQLTAKLTEKQEWV